MIPVKSRRGLREFLWPSFFYFNNTENMFKLFKVFQNLAYDTTGESYGVIALRCACVAAEICPYLRYSVGCYHVLSSTSESKICSSTSRRQAVCSSTTTRRRRLPQTSRCWWVCSPTAARPATWSNSWNASSQSSHGESIHATEATAESASSTRVRFGRFFGALLQADFL